MQWPPCRRRTSWQSVRSLPSIPKASSKSRRATSTSSDVADQTASHERALLRCENKALRRHRIEQRLDAEAVAREKQFFGLGVEDRQRPHAVEARQHPFLPRLPRRKNDLGIRLGAEHRALRFEFAPKLEEIVDFAIEDDHMATIGGHHRLVAARSRIDDRQPTVAKGDICGPH